MRASVRSIRGWLPAVFAIVVSACGRNRTVPADSTVVDTATRRDTTPSTVGVPSDSATALLETGCSGGVTGGGSGTFVTADGRFYRFQRGGPPPNAPRQLTFVRKDSARAVALVNAAERGGITRIKYSEPFNMTCHLLLNRGATSYEVDWPMGSTPSKIKALMTVAADLEAEGR